MPSNSQSSLHAIAETVAAEYISSVLFVDDVITYENSSNESALPAQKLIDLLAKDNISACFYRCDNGNQKNNILHLLKINDIGVLDWRINITRDIAEEDLDRDIHDDGGRGHFCKTLIEEVLRDESFAPCLLFIFTSEPTEVGEYLSTLPSEYRGSQYDSSDGSWYSENRQIRICFYAKEGGPKNRNIDTSKIISHEQIVPALKKEFARLHEGILPITLLRALTVIRKNTNKLLSKYDKNLDSAFVIHRALCPDPHSADNLLVNTISGALSSLFSYQNIEFLAAEDLVSPWIDEGQYKRNKLDIKKRPIDLSNEKRKKWHQIGYNNFFKEELINAGEKIENIPDNIHNYDQYKLSQEAAECFSNNLTDDSEIKKRNALFAILTHHKSIFHPEGYIPYLNFGCVLMAESNEIKEYYLCIQQTCDCLRINTARPFIFLPLAENPKAFNFIAYNGDDNFIFLAAAHKTSHDIQRFIFKPKAEERIVKSEKRDNSYIFTDFSGKIFHWLFDLKESFALKMVNEYAQKLTRIGVDESEWIRRSK